MADIVSVCVAFLTLYTITPMLFFILELHNLTPMGWYISDESLYLKVLIWHLIFSCAIQIPSIISSHRYRSKRLLDLVSVEGVRAVAPLTIGLVSVLGVLMGLLSLSSPVESYYDHYTRYDHYSGIARSVISVLVRSYVGLLPFVVVGLVVTLRNRPIWLLVSVLALCGLDVLYSAGSRIQSLMIALQALATFTLVTGVLRWRTLGVLVSGLLLCFLAIEVGRLSFSSNAEFDSTKIGFGGELLALFIPELHLLDLRHRDAMPSIPLGMAFKDVFELVPFFNAPAYDPMYWYWTNFHPDAPVPPFTMGPISDSVMFGGILGVVLRGLILGCVLLLIKRVLTLRGWWWVRLTVYTYAVSVAVLSLKYGIFTIPSLIILNLGIGLVIVLSIQTLVVSVLEMSRSINNRQEYYG